MGKKTIKIKKKDYAKLIEVVAVAKNEIEAQSNEIERLKNSLEQSKGLIKRITSASNVNNIIIKGNSNVAIITFGNGETETVNLDFIEKSIIKAAVFEAVIKRILGFDSYNKLISQIHNIESEHTDNNDQRLAYSSEK